MLTKVKMLVDLIEKNVITFGKSLIDRFNVKTTKALT